MANLNKVFHSNKITLSCLQYLSCWCLAFCWLSSVLLHMETMLRELSVRMPKPFINSELLLWLVPFCWPGVLFCKMRNCQIKSVCLYIGYPWQGLGSICEERPGVALCWTQMVLASSNCPAAGHSLAQQPFKQNLWENVFKKEQKILDGEREKGNKKNERTPQGSQMADKNGREKPLGTDCRHPTSVPLAPQGWGGHKGIWSEAEPGKEGKNSSVVMCLLVSNTWINNCLF